MKFSHYLTLAALTLSAVPVATYAQTSQTFRFGEGQVSMQPGNAHPTLPSQPQSPEAKAKEEHKAKHQRHYRHRVNAQDTYSHG